MAEMGHGVEREMGPTGRMGADNDRAVSRSEAGPRAGTSSALASHTAMWPSRDADGLIITKEPAPCVAAGSVENEDSPYQVEARSCLLSANGVCKPLPKPSRRTQTIVH